MISIEDEEKFDAATELLDQSMTALLNALDCDLSSLCHIPVERLILELSSGVETRFTPQGGVYYVVSAEAGTHLSGAAQHVPEAFEVLKAILASNIFEGAPLPYSLRCNAHAMILGNFPAAKRAGAKNGRDFTFRCYLYLAILSVTEIYDLSPTRNEASSVTVSACDAVGLVAKKHGVSVPYSRLVNWWSHRDHLSFRTRSKAMGNLLKDIYLAEIGALNELPSPFGVFLEFPQTTKD